jgi:hypothetical protein
MGDAKRRQKLDPHWGKTVEKKSTSDNDTVVFTADTYRAMVSLSAALNEKIPFEVEAREAAKRAAYYDANYGEGGCSVCGRYGCWESCS